MRVKPGTCLGNVFCRGQLQDQCQLRTRTDLLEFLAKWPSRLVAAAP
jgi:hypothetical protein